MKKSEKLAVTPVKKSRKPIPKESIGIAIERFTDRPEILVQALQNAGVVTKTGVLTDFYRNICEEPEPTREEKILHDLMDWMRDHKNCRPTRFPTNSALGRPDKPPLEEKYDALEYD